MHILFYFFLGITGVLVTKKLHLPFNSVAPLCCLSQEENAYDDINTIIILILLALAQ